MSDLAELWQELREAGLISGTPTSLGGGNADRRDADRSAWSARLPDGRDAKLTVAANLGDYAQRVRQLQAVLPGVAPALLLQHRASNLEVVAETFFAGVSLEDATAQPGAGGKGSTLQRLNEIFQALAATATDSTAAARDAEWNAWQAELLALPNWPRRDRALLVDETLPALHAALTAGPPKQQWVHGDLIGRNILVGTEGAVHLIDPEYAACTHFPEAEATRLRLFTPALAAALDQTAVSVEPPSTAAELFCWLEQVRREHAHNTPEYLARWLPIRFAEIRRLGRALVGGSNSESPNDGARDAVPHSGTQPVHFVIEQARWLSDCADAALLLTGWCVSLDERQPLREIMAQADGVTVAAAGLSERTDVQSHFKGRVDAARSGFELRLPPIEPDAELRVSALDNAGQRTVFWRVRAGDLPGRGPLWAGYSAWTRHIEPPVTSASNRNDVVFSMLLPVYRTPLPLLRACVDSVRAQTYPRWELCIVDDASADPAITLLLEEFTKADDRIRVSSRQKNGGIARATNDALTSARGDFVVMLDHDDVLRAEALASLAEALEREPSLDAVYSDEDKLDPDGNRTLPLFKPDFSPEFLRGVMYVGHVLSVRRSLAVAVGGFDPAFDGVQDYEFMLRVSERTRRIGHIPRVLYHWRQSSGSSALVGNVKGDMDAQQVAAVQAHLRRIGDARVAESIGGHRVRLSAGVKDDTAGFAMVRCGATDDPTSKLIAQATRGDAAPIVILVSAGLGDIGDDAQRELAALARLSDSGCVAPLILSSDGKVHESGCTVRGDRLVSLMQGFEASGDGYNGALVCNREVLAVSPLCVAVRTELVRAATGAGSWLELLGTIAKSGVFHRVCAAARVRLNAAATLERESRSSGEDRDNDLFYNPHFRRGGDYRLDPRPVHLRAALPPFKAAIETPPPSVLPFGWVDLRGWCFHLEQRAVVVRVRTGDAEWCVPVGLDRPDVAAALSPYAPLNCGFRARFGLPAGRTRLRIVATTTNGAEEQVLLDTDVGVPAGSDFRRWRSADPETLIRFQMMSAPSHAPQPLKPERWPKSRRDKLPKLSIVTPSFQQARFLTETLQSVLAQPVPVSLVVQDGGSTDGSVEVIRTYESRLAAWCSESDAGQADAIAKGFAKTSGGPDDVMAWINSDDFYMSGALGLVADYFTRHPEVDVIYGHRVLVDEHSQEIGRWFLPPHDDEVLRLNDFVPQETLFWRRRIWDKVGGIDPSFKFAMDWDLLLRFQAAGAKIVRVPYFLACFRIHSAQKTSAQMESVGQKEIDALRLRTFGRVLSPQEIENHPKLIKYLRKSAWIEFLWRRFGIRAR